MLRRVTLPLLTLLAFGTLTVSARAFTVTSDGGSVIYVASPGEANVLNVHLEGGALRFSQSVLEGVYACPGGGVACITSLSLQLGDAADRVDFGNPCFPTPGCKEPTYPRMPTSIDAGSGKDIIEAGPTNDTINLRDGEADTVTCGDGNDTVVGDVLDTIAADCEQVDIGVPNSAPGPVGVSINAATQYTNDPNVTLSLRWPRLASKVTVSNDGGFFTARTETVAATLSWKLDSSGPERLPKTVYVRFTGGASGPETYQDDIILDETDPVLERATLAMGASASALRAAKQYTVRLRAKDATSGVSGVQFAARKSKAGPVLKYRPTVRVRAGSAPKFVRVIDRAGNRSRWKTLQR